MKRAGSKLKSRIVAEQSIIKWCRMIEQMEDQVAAILQEERFLSCFIVKLFPLVILFCI